MAPASQPPAACRLAPLRRMGPPRRQASTSRRVRTNLMIPASRISNSPRPRARASRCQYQMCRTMGHPLQQARPLAPLAATAPRGRPLASRARLWQVRCSNSSTSSPPCWRAGKLRMESPGRGMGCRTRSDLRIEAPSNASIVSALRNNRWCHALIGVPCSRTVDEGCMDFGMATYISPDHCRPFEMPVDARLQARHMNGRP